MLKQSKERISRRTVPAALVFALALTVTAGTATAWPSAASAHGPVSPVASSFLARPAAVPQGLETKVIDGDQRLWLKVAGAHTVVVLDYRGAPYLRFTPAGVDVNHNSALYYLNQTPAEVPPAGLTRATPPRWARVSSAHDYNWHDGRLHALAGVSRLPGTTLVGRWSIPVTIDGQLSSISGGLWHSPNPSVVWFWPIIVIVACVLAAWRVRSESLDWSVARALAATALGSIAVAAIGQELHGRPSISAWQLIQLIALLAFVAWGVGRLVRRRHGYFFFFAVAIVALWEGIVLVPTLLHGYVLAAFPAVLMRATSVLCLGAGTGLLILAFRLGGNSGPEDERETGEGAELALMCLVLASALLLAGCGSSSQPTTTTTDSGLPANLVAESRPIGRGASFHPPATGPVLGACRAQLGPRNGVHIEVFAANRVVLVGSGIGTKPPRRFSAGRIAAARCYGDLVTLEPTGVVLARPGSNRTVADVFRSWGQPLSRARLGPFAASAGRNVEVFVDGRRWSGPPGAVPLRPHAEIVLEVGPHVPPHHSYTFPPGA